jgi:hypothetical protein
MTDHDMRALALNLANSDERQAGDVLDRAQKYYGFLSGRDEAKVNRSASTLTSSEIQQARAAQYAANALNPYNGLTALEMQEAMQGARGE